MLMRSRLITSRGSCDSVWLKTLATSQWMLSMFVPLSCMVDRRITELLKYICNVEQKKQTLKHWKLLVTFDRANGLFHLCLELKILFPLHHIRVANIASINKRHEIFSRHRENGILTWHQPSNRGSMCYTWYQRNLCCYNKNNAIYTFETCLITI